MDELPLDPNPGCLAELWLEQLRTLVAEMQEHSGPWGEWRGGEEVRRDDGRISRQMRYTMLGPLALSAMEWLYESRRLVAFDWVGWDEGREIYKHWTDATAATLDHLTVRKLLTAVARNNRFMEGAWMDLFETGIGAQLFARLLELEEALASSS